MAQISIPATDKTVVQAVAEKAARLHFVDHLRAALVALVVLHHVALVYGAGAPFYYVEPPLTAPLAYITLLVFALFNQAWFMGTLFLLAGYFTPGSYERKGARAFLRGRLVRLGIPLLFFYFVLNPLSSIGYWQMPATLTGITDPLTWQAYPFLLGMGPLWFVALLLIFDFGYATWQGLAGDRRASTTGEAATPGYLAIGLFVLGLALASYLVRMVIPMGAEVLDFPTLSYLPQYLSFFALGAIASRHDWLRRLPGSLAVAGLVMAALASLFLFPLALSGSLFSLELTDPAGFVGNGTWESAVYALWDSTFAVGMCLAALIFFRRFFDGSSAFGGFLSRQSYAVYIIHTPIVVFLAIALQEVALQPLLKFAVASLIALPLCFAVAYVVRRLPLARRVL
jgi:hypothetical protein